MLTAYNVPDYGGPGQHLYIASSRGNKDKQSEEYLGRDFVRPRVLIESEIALYHLVRRPDGTYYLNWLTEIANKGIPEWIFLKL